MSPASFRFRPTLVNPPSQCALLPVFDVPTYTTPDEILPDASQSGHRVFTTVCNDSVWHTIERLHRLGI